MTVAHTCYALLIAIDNINTVFEIGPYYCYCDVARHTLGYEPAGLTVHPPPECSRVGSFFSHRCLVPPKIFLQQSGFCTRHSHWNHQNVVLRHNHLNPISTKLTSFDNNE